MPAPVRPNFNLNSSFLFDALIVGAGPAGLSAALALCRMKRPVVVFSSGDFRNAKAHRAHTILSRDHQPASEIHRIGREQIDQYGTTHFVERSVIKARKDDAANVFEVEDQDGEKWRGKKVVLAVGAKDKLPTDIDGYSECWGESIWQCMFCDGIERSDRPAGMLGFASPMNLHNVSFILQFGCPALTIFANGPLKPSDEATTNALEVAKAKGAKVDERRIEKLVHLDNEQGIDVLFEDGCTTRVGFIAHTPNTEVAAPNLALDLGVEILPDGMGGTLLKRNEPLGETNVKSVFTAGDAGHMMKQFTAAMFQGVAAGAGVAFQLEQEGNEKIVRKLKTVDELESEKRPEGVLSGR